MLMRPALISRAVAAGTVRRPFNRARPLTSFFRCIEDARPLNSSCKLELNCPTYRHQPLTNRRLINSLFGFEEREGKRD